MDYEEMKNIVLEQSAKDMMCDKNDFLKNEITVVSMTDDEKSQNRGNKKSIPSKLFCNLVYFGKSLVCTCDLKVASQIQNLLENDLDKNEIYRAFEPDFIYKLNEVLFPFERKINCMANFCLPSKNFFETKTPSVNIENFSFKFFFNLYPCIFYFYMWNHSWFFLSC